MNSQLVPDGFSDLMEEIWRYCVNLVAQGVSHDNYVDAMQALGRQFSPDEHEFVSWPMLRIIGDMVWRKTPQPHLRYGLPVAAKAERNAPCPCHSGRKYKQCCLPLEQAMPPMPEVNFLPMLLEALPRKRWGELVGSHVPVDMVQHAAFQWHEEDRSKDVCSLLEPWFAVDAGFHARHEGLFDALLDAYSDLSRPRKKAQLLERALAVGDRRLRSVALQRKATMLADRHDFHAAWQLFAEAQRADPQSPNLSHLEIILLITEGREPEARERAKFWAHRLTAMRDPELAGLIDLMREVSEHGASALQATHMEADPALGDLLELFKAAPPIASQYTLAPDAETVGPLAPTPLLRKALRAWDKANDVSSDWQTLGMGEPGGADVDAWLPVLRAHPQLWNSFELLDAMVVAIQARDTGPPHAGILQPVLDRGEQLLREVLRANHAEGKRMEWGWVENRPALSLLGHCITDLGERPGDPAQLARLEWLVCTLNPNDNQGFRHALVRAYLCVDRAGDALVLCERYSDDFAAMQYNHVLTLYALNRHDQALAALQKTVADYPKPLAWLLKAKPKAPPMSPYGMSLGGDDEAWFYRQDTLPLWEKLGAMEWLRACAKAIKHRG